MAPHVLRDFEMVRSEYGLPRKVGHADEGHARADPRRVPYPEGRPSFRLARSGGRQRLRLGAPANWSLSRFRPGAGGRLPALSKRVDHNELATENL